MKKALLVLAVLCVAGIFSAKAQSPSDSAYARNLSYTYFNISSLPNSVTDSLSNGGKYLKDQDLRFGSRAKGYAINLTTTKTLDIYLNQTSWTDWDEYLYLLDSNFNLITYNDDYYTGGSRILRSLAPGNYYIIAAEYYSGTSDKSYILTIDEITPTNLNALTYLPLGTFNDTTVNDTFAVSYPYVQQNNNIYRAKGYSFQGTQNKVVVISDYYDDAYYVLMDNNHNIMKIGYSIGAQLPQTGTYYLAILDQPTYMASTTISIKNYQTYYVDGINGDDSRNGLSPSTAFATLDTAIVRSGGVGKYYLTEDYTFSDNYLLTYYAQIYPYQKDIQLHMPTTSGDDILDAAGDLVFGEQGGNYYFIIDSSHTEFYYGLLYGYSGSSIKVNNLKVRNSYLKYFVYDANELVMRDCEFVNDTFNEYFIVKGNEESRNVQIINTDFSQNYLNYYFIAQSNSYYTPDTMIFTLENTTVAGNTFGSPQWIYNGAIVNLVSGSWSNNSLSTDYTYNGNPNLTTQNWGGIWLWGVTATIGAGFSMDVNNFLSIDTATTLKIEENFSGNNVAQIYPYRYDNSDDLYKADYYEGRRVLWGTSSLLANNYQKFGIAQADNSSLWYLHSDGKIYTTEEPVGLNQAEEGTISLYPNPANNVLNIALQGSEVNEAVVIDIYGKTVARTTVSEGNNTLNISALPAGMYFVQLRAAGSVKSTQKIIKR